MIIPIFSTGPVIVVMEAVEDGLFLNFTGNIRRFTFWDGINSLMWAILIIIF